jgi:hypothetical protein
MMKVAMAQHPVPYEKEDLEALGKRCTEEEDAANKVRTAG